MGKAGQVLSSAFFCGKEVLKHDLLVSLIQVDYILTLCRLAY